MSFQYPARNHYAVDWHFPEHKRFDPPDLAASLCYEPTEPESVDGRAVRLRADYPDPEYNTMPFVSSWYPDPDPDAHQYTVLDALEGQNVPRNEGQAFCFPVIFN